MYIFKDIYIFSYIKNPPPSPYNAKGSFFTKYDTIHKPNINIFNVLNIHIF